MQASRTISAWTFGLPAGAWRWAAIVFAVVALAAAALALSEPDEAGFAGYALLGGIGAVASLLLYAVWPRETLKTEDAKRVAARLLKPDDLVVTIVGKPTGMKSASPAVLQPALASPDRG